MESAQKMFAAVGMWFTVILVVVALSTVMAYPIKWCWNYTMPEIFRLPEIGALQAWCLSFLAHGFFKATLNCKH